MNYSELFLTLETAAKMGKFDQLFADIHSLAESTERIANALERLSLNNNEESEDSK